MASPIIKDWPFIKRQFQANRGNRDSAILLGNGASCAIWPQFAYQSLFKEAQRKGSTPQLSNPELAIFNSLRTESPEFVLGELSGSEKILSALNGKAVAVVTGKVKKSYHRIRCAFVKAIQRVHIPYTSFLPGTARQVVQGLERYHFVFTTNYDLMVYWARLIAPPKKNRNRFKDYFFQNLLFDNGNTTEDRRRRTTFILYLHGGLHLFLRDDGRTKKRKSEEGSGILTQLESAPGIALVVSEGTSQKKLDAINRNDYLRFAYNKLCRHAGTLVIFGHSLAKGDEHVVTAINESPVRAIAISVRSGENGELRKKCARYIEDFPRKKVQFFRAETHPLGQATLDLSCAENLP